MFRPVLAILGIFVVPVAGATSALSFDAPAIVSGEQGFQTEMAVILPRNQSTIALPVESGTLRVWSGVRVAAEVESAIHVGNSSQLIETGEQTHRVDSRMRLSLAPVPGEVQLLVLNLAGKQHALQAGHATLAAGTQGQCISRIPGMEPASHAWIGETCLQNARPMLIGRDAVLQVDSRIEELAWFGYEATCTPSCGDSTRIGRSASAAGVSTDAHSTSWGRVTYERAQGVSLGFRGNSALIGPAVAALQLDGFARLPGAQVEGSTLGKAEETLRLEGNFLIENLVVVGDSRMAGDARFVGGAASLDETYVDPESIFGPKAAVAATGISILTLLAAVKFLAPLFTRIPPEKALEHERRKLLADYIKEHPGATFRELLRETEIPAGTARHHLTILRRSGVTMERRHHSTLRFFENHGKFDETWVTVAVLREPEMERLHTWIKDNPGAAQMDILDAMMADGWTRSTTQHRIKRLENEGLVTAKPQGRLKLYEAHDTPQPREVDPWVGLGSPSYA